MTTPPGASSVIRTIDWTRLRTELIWVYQGEIETPYRDAREHHPGCSALLIRKGTLYIETAHGAATATQGQWIFPREGPRLQRFSADARILSLHFNLHFPGKISLFEWDVAFMLPSATQPELERQAFRLLRIAEKHFPGAGAAMAWRHCDIRTHFLLHQAFSGWVNLYVNALLRAGCVPSRLHPVDPRVEHAIQTIDDLPLNVRFDKSWLGREVHLSASQLDRLFSLHFKQTPRQYYEKRRIAHAKELLKTAPLSIKQIAYEVGFHSQPFFSRWFREQTGRSPREYMQGGF